MMALWLYRSISWLLLPLVIPLLAIRDRLREKSRPSWVERFAFRLQLGRADLWIQAVSVGEVELGTQLVRHLLRLRPDLRILVTATTATGLALARKRLAESCQIAACPVDLPGPLRRFLSQARPAMIVLIETELWPEMLHQARRQGIPVAVVNARLSEKSCRNYRRILPLLKPLLEPLGLVLARDRSDLEAFRSLGIEESRLCLGGNLKFDLRPDERPLEWEDALKEASGDRPIILAGSTMAGEEDEIFDALMSASLRRWRPLLILAPRHPERFESVAELISSKGLSFVRRSRLPDSGIGNADVFLLDTIGELARAYRLGSMAFIGGSLVPTGGHNPLEALLWGVPVLSGPSTENFREIYRKMLEIGAVRLVSSAGEVAEAINLWLEDPAAAVGAGQAGREYILHQGGATARVARKLLETVGDRG